MRKEGTSRKDRYVKGRKVTGLVGEKPRKKNWDQTSSPKESWTVKDTYFIDSKTDILKIGAPL